MIAVQTLADADLMSLSLFLCTYEITHNATKLRMRMCCLAACTYICPDMHTYFAWRNAQSHTIIKWNADSTYKEYKSEAPVSSSLQLQVLQGVAAARAFFPTIHSISPILSFFLERLCWCKLNYPVTHVTHNSSHLLMC